MAVFYFFASLIVWQGIISLLGGFRYLAFVRQEMRFETDAKDVLYAPFVSVIAPCRGLDQGLRENLAALFAQTYPAYEIVFVTDKETDASLAVFEELCQKQKDSSNVKTRVIVAGAATKSGQKVHNLRAAVRQINLASVALVFVDTDARPREDWLRSLIAPLADEGIGATTGYRWYVPTKEGFASKLRAVWNASIASALGERVHRNFCWGGSTAIRREVFERLNILERWRGTLSDDFTLTRALRESRLPVKFVPNCLTVSHDDCTLAELFEFTTRQMKITRVYQSHFWKISLVTNLFFVLVFFGGIALVCVRAALGLSYWLPLLFVLGIYALGSWKAYLRLKAIALPLAHHRAELRRDALAHLFWWPLASMLYLYNALAAAFSRCINWRGIVYELKSPTETLIIPVMKTNEHVNAEEAAPRA